MSTKEKKLLLLNLTRLGRPPKWRQKQEYHLVVAQREKQLRRKVESLNFAVEQVQLGLTHWERS